MSEPTTSALGGVLSRDTTADSERKQIELWRRLSSVEKAALVTNASTAVMTLAMAGIRHRHPKASDRECFLRLAALTLGAELTRTVYPDAHDIADLGT
jgi:hypothetical protein